MESKVASAEAIIELLPAVGLPEDRKTAANRTLLAAAWCW